jgi:glycosyltransferase involved in cell wall biosynthesis
LDKESKNRKNIMKILIVAMADSVHTSRWLSYIVDQGWDIHLFPSMDRGVIYPTIRNVTVHHSLFSGKTKKTSNVKCTGIPVFFWRLQKFGIAILTKYIPHYRNIQLKRLIKKINPDIIHSMEFQSAGYLVASIKEDFPNNFPIWIATSWGSDLYLFGRLSEHVQKVKGVLSKCDYYSTDCQRDVKLAKTMGFNGKLLPVIPAAGGFDLEKIIKFRNIPPSKRKLILVKGYQSWSGRALVALTALKQCNDLLKEYTIEIFASSGDVTIASELLSQDIGIPVKNIHVDTHTEMLIKFGKARLFVGLGISDGTPSTMLESMVMGAFPIQSNTACADEWIINDVTGIIVPPEDPNVVAKAIQKALIDDQLVDTASQLNLELARRNLDNSVIKPRILGLYNEVYDNSIKE